jgi:C-terminal processing protease CtpA/Prc
MQAASQVKEENVRVVCLQRVANSFGLTIVELTGGKGVTVGAMTPGGAADQSHKINIGDRILKVMERISSFFV